MTSTNHPYLRKHGPSVLAVVLMGLLVLAVVTRWESAICDTATAELAAKEAVLHQLPGRGDATVEPTRTWQNGDGTYISQLMALRVANGDTVRTGYVVSLICGAGNAIEVIEVQPD